MKKLLISLLFTVAPFSTAVAEGAFDGVNLQLGFGASMTKSQENQSFWQMATGTTNQSFTFNKTNLVGSVALGYSHGFSNRLNLATNVFYNASSNNAGSNTQTLLDGSSLTRTMSLKNVMGISFEPGYYFAKDILGYLKLGVAQASSSMSYSFSSGGTADPENFGNTNGFLLGFGGKYALTENFYLGAEFYQINFAKKTNYYHNGAGTINENSFTISNQPTYNYGGLTLGYRF